MICAKSCLLINQYPPTHDARTPELAADSAPFAPIPWDFARFFAVRHGT